MCLRHEKPCPNPPRFAYAIMLKVGGNQYRSLFNYDGSTDEEPPIYTMDRWYDACNASNWPRGVTYTLAGIIPGFHAYTRRSSALCAARAMRGAGGWRFAAAVVVKIEVDQVQAKGPATLYNTGHGTITYTAIRALRRRIVEEVTES